MSVAPCKTSRSPRILVLFALAALLAWSAATLAADAPDDGDIALAVNERLFDDPGVSNLLIDVTVDEGVVSLTGSVVNLTAKDRATRLAETVKGVRAVVDRIRVVPHYRPEAELQAAVASALANHPAVDAARIEVTVDGQGATLTGSADSQAERNIAGRVARGVSGLEALDNRIEVEPPTQRPDAEVEQEIEAILAWDALIDDDKVVVEVRDGRASLAGQVASLAEKRRAGEQAALAGVRSVDTSGLAVSTWQRDPRFRKQKYARLDRPDAAVADAVRDALARDPRVTIDSVEVDVTGGKATLSGHVDELYARRAAGDTARNTLGVYRVVNRIRVQRGAVPDDTLRDRVAGALKERDWLADATIAVVVENGVVTLSGTVDGVFEKALADTTAAAVSGVAGVENDLVVTRSGERLGMSPYVDPELYVDETTDHYEWGGRPMLTGKNDWAIHEDIRDELFWSPFVESEQVSIEVDNGHVTLEGTVDSWFERTVAEENAYAGGAVIVDNDLRVRYGPDYYAPAD